ncbi:MAG: 2,3-bisphosphoglycerate-independent phosphoglycerate mutase [Candidatus Aminicenantales bacterium]
MDWEKLAKDLTIETNTKIVLLVIDGLGDLPQEGKTPLEAAQTPHLDTLAAQSVCGLTDPVFRGITPGSGPAHLALFGYNPTKYILGRGILEALGIGIDVGCLDLVARGNFATLKDGLIVDRRAGRIPTSQNEELCRRLNKSLKKERGIDIILYPGREHRFVVKFSGQNLSDALSDADPQKEGKPPVLAKPLAPEAGPTADLVNSFIKEATEILSNSQPANTVLLRGFAKHPSLPTMEELYKLKPVAIAHYPMYKGLAKLVGMELAHPEEGLAPLFSTVAEIFNDFNFFYVHVKKTDSAGEDGHYQAKKAVIEEVDAHLPRLLRLHPEVLAVTSDHSTPCLLKSHSWHPNPFLLHSATSQPDRVSSFSERECSQGYLGRFPSIYAMPLMLAHAGKLKKFGA